jgi:hypothetical protein
MQTLTSREYKLMLKPDRFKGSDEKLLEAAAALWGDLAGIIEPNVIAVSGTDDVRHRRRRVRLLDTADHWLRANDYVVRERVDLENNERQVTLKFRHADRFISQGRTMTPAEGFEPDMKFEEDIKAPFQAFYSFSSNIILGGQSALETLAHVDELYPGLRGSVDEFPETKGLIEVNGLAAYERVIKGTSFQIRRDPEVSAQCALTIWYGSEDSEDPIISEFSFTYEDEKEEYTAKMARRAYDAFMAIQEHLGGWIERDSMTKTTYVYSFSGEKPG